MCARRRRETVSTGQATDLFNQLVDYFAIVDELDRQVTELLGKQVLDRRRSDFGGFGGDDGWGSQRRVCRFARIRLPIS